MARGTKGSGLTRSERPAGLIFFIVYLFVMPLLFSKLIALVETLLATNFSAATENAIYYYFIVTLTILIFHKYLWATSQRFLKNIGGTCSTVAIGLLVFYGGNELFYRVTHLLWQNTVNLNDVSIAAQVVSAPRMTALIVIALAPFVEEVLFRGFVFGALREKSRFLAYLVSAALFAFMHVWQYLLSGWDFSYLILMLQYLFPAFVFAWAYDRSGNLWGSVMLHAAVNALSLFVLH